MFNSKDLVEVSIFVENRNKKKKNPRRGFIKEIRSIIKI